MEWALIHKDGMGWNGILGVRYGGEVRYGRSPVHFHYKNAANDLTRSASAFALQKTHEF
jgi:hypothetical protein